VPLTSSELINAVSHPLRRRILFAYVEGAVECASAQELAEAMDQQVARVLYHLQTLARGEILRPVQSGGVEAHCVWVLGVEAEWLRLVLEVWAESNLSP
jgi:DNA-binding transcriptional ArsR family regulator